MSFTEQDRLNQEKKAAELAAEFDRLDAVFADLLKEGNLTPADLAKLDPDNPPAELKEAVAEARRAARKAGEGQAALLCPAPSGPAGPKARPRDGTLRA